MVEHFLDEPKLHDHGSIRTTFNDREMTSLQKMVMNYPDILSVGERESKAHGARCCCIHLWHFIDDATKVFIVGYQLTRLDGCC
jgi:hypothetical protein